MAKAAKWVAESAEQRKALRKIGIWRKQDRNKTFSLMVADVATQITNGEALLGVDAQWDALDILFDQSTDELAKRRYVESITLLEREHTILSDKKLHEAWAAYAPSARIAKAAEKLREAAAEIEEQAKAIERLASLLGAITKFVSALQ
jgi:hypothetical protein